MVKWWQVAQRDTYYHFLILGELLSTRKELCVFGERDYRLRQLPYSFSGDATVWTSVVL